MSAYHRRLVGPDKEEMLKCAKAWARWEMATAKLFVDPSMLEKVCSHDRRLGLSFPSVLLAENILLRPVVLMHTAIFFLAMFFIMRCL